jgi:APA family basic amino acid/polyamine antiporter
MAGAGMLPRPLAHLTRRTAAPLVATAAVVGVAAAFVLLGDLAQAAELTDAAVLSSFAIVNLALVALAGRRSIPWRLADVVIPTLGALLCGWLLSHTGAAGIALTAAFATVGVLLATMAGRSSDAQG